METNQFLNIFIMALWVLDMIFIIKNVIWYLNVYQYVYRTKFDHFMDDVFLVIHNHLPTLFFMLSTKTKKSN